MRDQTDSEVYAGIGCPKIQLFPGLLNSNIDKCNSGWGYPLLLQRLTLLVTRIMKLD